MPLPWSKEGKLLAAVKNNNFYKVEELLKKKVNPNIFDMVDRHILSHAAARANPQIIELLLKSGADPNQAVYEGYTEVAKILLDSGADANTVDNVGRNAIGLASQNGHSEIVNLLETAQ